MLSLVGKVALVTGASRGIGRGIAATLVKAGARVALCDLEAVSAVAAAAEMDSARAAGFEIDVTNADSIAAAIGQVVAHFGSINILVNNAGVFQRGLGLDIDAADFLHSLDVNTVGVWRVVQAALPHLRASKGTVITIASNGGRKVASFAPGYCASKAAVISLTQSLAQLVGPDGVRVNAVCPGSVDTAMTREIRAMLSSGEDSPPVLTVPLPGAVTAEDIGNAVAFLASELARTITGQALLVDRGEVMV